MEKRMLSFFKTEPDAYEWIRDGNTWKEFTYFHRIFIAKSKKTFHFLLCNHHIFRRLQRGSQKVPFYDVKDALLHGKRASFEVQKGVF